MWIPVASMFTLWQPLQHNLLRDLWSANATVPSCMAFDQDTDIHATSTTA